MQLDKGKLENVQLGHGTDCGQRIDCALLLFRGVPSSVPWRSFVAVPEQLTNTFKKRKIVKVKKCMTTVSKYKVQQAIIEVIHFLLPIFWYVGQ